MNDRKTYHIKEIREAWFHEVHKTEIASEVDPDDEYTWEGVCVGWLMGKYGMAPEEARTLAQNFMPL